MEPTSPSRWQRIRDALFGPSRRELANAVNQLTSTIDLILDSVEGDGTELASHENDLNQHLAEIVKLREDLAVLVRHSSLPNWHLPLAKVAAAGATGIGYTPLAGDMHAALIAAQLATFCPVGRTVTVTDAGLEALDVAERYLGHVDLPVRCSPD
jgi:hypothetical protein